jgi:hypothetical protein
VARARTLSLGHEAGTHRLSWFRSHPIFGAFEVADEQFASEWKGACQMVIIEAPFAFTCAGAYS